jgi:hypothetical protein
VKGSSTAIVIFLGGVIIAGLAGGYEWRPIVDYQLTGPDTITISPYENRTFQFQFYADNTGQTDILIDVNVTAINATISTSEGFATSVSSLILLKAKTGAMGLAFYLLPNPKASSFVVSINSVNLHIGQVSGISDVITSLIGQFGEFHAINRQSLIYVRDTSQYSLV